MPEYGRNVQYLVEHAKTLESFEERNRAARSVITIMGNMNPHLRDVNDFKHKLWDHLAIMSGFDFDIEWPYSFPEMTSIFQKPDPIPFVSTRIAYKHFGKIIEKMIEKATELPECPEKQALIQLIANHMKKSYLTWNKEVVSDEVIFKAIEELSQSKITFNNRSKLMDSRDILAKGKRPRITKKPIDNRMKRR